MTSKIKRFLSMALAVLMLMTMMPATVLAEDEVEYVCQVGEGTDAKQYATLADAVSEAVSGSTIILFSGNHNMPGFSHKELTFKGLDKATTSITDYVDYQMHDAVIHFKDLTINGTKQLYKGLKHTKEVTYENCNINSKRLLYAHSVSFEGCNFDSNGADHSFWTYGSSYVSVRNCSFTYSDRAVNCYSESGANHETTVSFSGCKFYPTGSSEGAVEINSSLIKSIEVSMDGCSAPSSGKMWFIPLQYDSKDGANTVVNVNDNKVWPVLIAKIGDKEYFNIPEDGFAAAMKDANAVTGEVTVEIYGEVEFVNGMELKNGSYSKINFVGKTDNAKITINQSAGGDYLEAHGKTVTFKDLKLAKANPAWSGNSGHMGNYFSIQGGTITYTNCTFPNGACANTSTAVYNGCSFRNSSEYGLWVYDDAKVTVNGGTFSSVKGIKVYSEGEGSVTSTLTVRGATFTSSVSAKPAICIAYAERISLSGNTYNNPTGVLELDSGSDADCEGISFSADNAASLTATDRSNSNAPCGVLMDGKIYTYLNKALEDADAGDTITLLYDHTDTADLNIEESITLDLNGKNFNGSLVLKSENVTLTGPEGMEVTTDVEDYVVVYANGVYKVVSEDATFIVTFNSNNGSGSMDPQTFNVGTAQALSANKFTRSGYTFTGWNTAADGSGMSYANKTQTTITSDITLYAQWRKNPSYTVTFDPNGGEGERTTQTFTEGVSQALNANTFTRKNFYFTGWMDDNGNHYSNKEVIQVPGNITLYAQWARVPSTTSYTVQYNANGGSGSVYLQAFTSSMTFELRMNEFVREGYKFAGWNTKADGTGDAYAEGASFSGSIKKSIVLYAQWKLDVPEFPAVRPEYKIEVEGQEGKITRTNDTSIVFDKMFIRWSIGFDTVDGPFAMIAILDVVWEEGQEGLVGTFTIPVIQTNGTISGVNYMLTTDPNANMVGVGEAAKDMYGMLIK